MPYSWSIKRKLIVITVLAAGISLLFAAAVFTHYELASLRRTNLRQAEMIADIVSGNSAAALAFSDAQAAAETLRALNTTRQVVAACLYTKDGAILAKQLTDENSANSCPNNPRLSPVQVAGSTVTVIRAVKLDGERVGMLYLQFDFFEWGSRITAYLLLTVAVLAGAILIALTVSTILQKIITRPIRHLAEVAQGVSEQKNYSLRATRMTNDEIGSLIDSFNEMLAQIQLRDEELLRYQSDLEAQVEKRTSQLTELNSNLRSALAEAEAAYVAKSMFLANMSHEIRTPMNGIMGLTESVLESSLAPDQRDSLEVVLASANGLLGLINDILDFSKIEAGKLQIDPVDFEFRKWLAQHLVPLEASIRKKGISLVSEIDASVPRAVIADPIRVGQIITNLLGNAVKFSPENSEISIHVAAEAEGAGKIKLQFAVRDQGIGIASDKIPVIFELFSQVDASITRKYGGTGLGLAICRELTQLMGGSIWVESEIGKGSTFFFTVQTLISNDLNAGSGVRTRQLVEEAFSMEPLQILLVEDNPVNQKVAVKLLERFGHQISISNNGREALAACEKTIFDLIFMDCQMPEMDGFTATKFIREQEAQLGRHTPIVAMTAHAMAGDREKCIASGMDDYISKPISRTTLIEVIKRARKKDASIPTQTANTSPAAS